MSDAAITAIVAAVVQIAGLFFAWLTLWVRARQGLDKTEEVDRKAVVAANKANQAALKADTIVQKLDDNTALTEKVDKQTNGAAEATRARIEAIERQIVEMKEYSHKIKHDLANSVNNLSLKIDQLLLARQEAPSPLTPKPPPAPGARDLPP